jgi:hypothetical protein
VAIGRLTQLATAITATSGLSISATVPNDGSVAVGDILLVACGMPSGSRTLSISGGSGTWTSLGSAAVSGHTTQIWWKPCASGDLAASITVTHAGGAGGIRQLLLIGKISGVSTATPFGSAKYSGTATSTQATTKTTPALTSVTTVSREISLVCDTRGATTPNTTTWTAPSGQTKQGDLYTTSSTGLSMTWGDSDATVSGTVGGRVWTADQPALGSMWTLAALEGSATPVPGLTHQIGGAQATTGFTAAFKTSDVATGVRLAVSTSSGMTSPTYFGPAVPDTGGYSKISATGLSANTPYFYAAELDGVLGARVGSIRTLPAAGTFASFGFAAASCAVAGSTNAVFDAIRTRTGTDAKGPLFFAHLGDLQYVYGSGATAPADETALTAAAELALASGKQQDLYQSTSVSYTWSDVDFGGSNSDGTYACNATQQTVYRKIWPHPADIPASTGIYRTWVVGRVRFIQTDSRSFMSLKSATDNSSKTMLGATQKAWLKTQLTAAEPFKIWLHDNAWVGSASNPGNDDRWRAFSTERAEIAAYLAANSATVGKLLYVHGDTHAVLCDDGTNNAFGGFPFACVAPMDQAATPWDLTGSLTGGAAYPGDTSTVRMYGWFDVVDTGSAISVAFNGYDGAGTSRASQTITADTTRTLAPTGIASTATIGAPTAAPGSVTVAATGIPAGSTVGVAQAQPGPVTLSPVGVPSTAVLGAATAAPGSLTLTAAGIGSTASLGTAQATPGIVTLTAAGIAPAATFGHPTAQPGPVTVQAAGILSTLALGQPAVVPTPPDDCTVHIGAPQGRWAVSAPWT